MGELSSALQAPTRQPPRELTWADCDDCGSRNVLARATVGHEVYDHTHGICLECGAVLCCDADECGVAWVTTWSGEGPDFYGTRRVGAVALAAARRLAGWGRVAWWDREDVDAEDELTVYLPAGGAIDLHPPAWHATANRRWTCPNCILQHNGREFASPYSFSGNGNDDDCGACADCGAETLFYLVVPDAR